MSSPYILENLVQCDITEQKAAELLAAGKIYDSGEGYYHLSDGVTYEQLGL